MPGIKDFLRATLRHADLLHTLALRLGPAPGRRGRHRARRPTCAPEPPGTGGGSDDAGAWLATICLNADRDERRRHARRCAALYDGPVPDLPGRADTAEAALDRLGSETTETGRA